jgi:acetolactate synthase-1/2/3 large subunit
LIAAVREADLIIALGARLGENPTQGYTLFDPAETAAKLVHIHPDPDELGKVWPAALAIPADANLAAAQLAAAVAGSPPDRGVWRAQLRAAYEAWSAPIEVSGAVNLSQCFAHMSAALPADAIVCNGAGNYAAWLHRFFRHRAGGRQLAPTSGAMGYGVPAAIAAKIIAPERTVVAVAGDGCFLMTGQELATAVQHDAAIIVIVVDNGSYGTIRMHQERSYPQRTVATDLVNPDFVEFAHAFGFWAALVEHTEDFPEALAQARACGRPALLHVRVSVNDISPGRTLASLRPA